MEWLYCLIAGALYAAVFYLKNITKEQFDATKFVATVFFGALVGVALEIMGVEITVERVEEKIIMYSGLIAILESIIKAIVRVLRRW